MDSYGSVVIWFRDFSRAGRDVEVILTRVMNTDAVHLPFKAFNVAESLQNII